MANEIMLAFIPVVAAIGGWMIKQGNDSVKEATSNATEAKQEAALASQAAEGLKELINTRFDSLESKQDERHESVDYRLQRVEKSMNGFLRHEEYNVN